MASFEVELIRDDTTFCFSLTKVLPEAECPFRRFSGTQVISVCRSTVQRGTLVQDGLPDEDTVCKFVRGDLSYIRKEVKLYVDDAHLKGLQGSVVPTFFGYFEGTADVGGREIAVGCMILEYCGLPLTHTQYLDDDIKAKIIRSLLAIHFIGHLEHNDMDDNYHHVLVRDTKGEGRMQDMTIRIADFDRSRKHECSMAMTVDQWAYEPPKHEFKCAELFNVTWRLGIWTPRYITFMGFKYDIFQVCTVTRLVRCAKRRFKHARQSEAFLARKAQETLDNYYKAFHNRFSVIGHPLHYKVPLNIPGEPEPDDTKYASGSWTPPKPVWKPGPPLDILTRDNYVGMY